MKPVIKSLTRGGTKLMSEGEEQAARQASKKLAPRRMTTSGDDEAMRSFSERYRKSLSDVTKAFSDQKAREAANRGYSNAVKANWGTGLAKNFGLMSGKSGKVPEVSELVRAKKYVDEHGTLPTWFTDKYRSKALAAAITAGGVAATGEDAQASAAEPAQTETSEGRRKYSTREYPVGQEAEGNYRRLRKPQSETTSESVDTDKEWKPVLRRPSPDLVAETETAREEEKPAPSLEADRQADSDAEKERDTDYEKKREAWNRSLETEIKSVYDGLDEKLEQLPKSDRSWYQSQMSKLKETYEGDKQRLGFLQLAEKIGQALVQLGAAHQGLRTGADMSGLQFEKADWEKKFDRILRERQGEEESVLAEQELRDRELAEENRDKSRTLLEEAKSRVRDLVERRQMQFDADMQDSRAEQRKREQAEREARRRPTEPRYSREDLDKLRKLDRLDKSIERARGELAALSAPGAKKTDKRKAAQRALGYYAEALPDTPETKKRIEELSESLEEPGWWDSLFGDDRGESGDLLLEELRSVESQLGQARDEIHSRYHASPESQYVRVRYQGQPIEILRQNLNAALADGAELIE